MSPGLLSLIIYARLDGLYDVGRGELTYSEGVSRDAALTEAARHAEDLEPVFLVYEDGRGYEELAA